MPAVRDPDHKRRPPENPKGPNLAAAWYVAMPSRQLRARPRAVELFGRNIAIWRSSDGRPVAMDPYCPHQGANLALGSVVAGALRCPFHSWRYDSSGRCISIPGVERIPPAARVRTYPTVDLYGLVWIWYGTSEPLYDVPDFPPLTSKKGRYIGFRYSDRTTGTVRHLLENAVDYYHFLTLHGLSMKDLRFQMLQDPCEASDNGAELGMRDAWFGVRIEGTPTKRNPLRHPWEWLSSTVSTFALGSRFDLLVDGWPGGQRFTAYVDGHEVYKVLMGITPVGDRQTTQVGWAGVIRTGRWWRTLFNLLLFYGQNRGGTMQDVPIYDTTVTDDHAMYVKYDNGVLRFRQYYQGWVDAARGELTEAGR